jgi:hypothetical protein
MYGSNLSSPVDDFSASFTITAGTTTVTGTKTWAPPQSLGSCGPSSGTITGQPATYEATIVTPSGTFHDEGTASVVIQGGVVTETFVSSLSAPTPLLPTSKEQCKKNGWQAFGVFKNQGDCVSFVATDGKNGPSGP